MHFFEKIYCRTVQFFFRLAIPVLPYREPERLDSIDKIPALLKSVKIEAALLVTDAVIMKTEASKRLVSRLTDSGIICAVYDSVRPNPTVHNVEEAFKIYTDSGAGAIIAFGGGSSMDCAKAVGARAAYPQKSVNRMKGLLKVLKPIPTLIAIPTTAGTGSEVTLTAVITDSDRRHKYTMNSFTLIPRYAVLDPAVTVSLPKNLTATTGMDALTHAVEAYIGRSTTKETRRLALEAVKLIFKNIEIVCRDGNDIDARKQMLTAAYKAGVAFSKSYVGYVHAVAHSLGGQYNIPHGFANAVLLPIVLEEYGSSVHKKLHRIGIAAGVSLDTDSDEVGAGKFIEAVKTLNKDMGIPDRISGIEEKDIAGMSRYAAAEANPLYPVPKLWNAGELEKIYRKAADKIYIERV